MEPPIPMIFHVKDWLPLIVSVFALLVSAIFGWTAQSDRRSAARLAREKDLHVWAREIGEIYTSLLLSNADEAKRALARLSILIDFGRLVFPNERAERALREYSAGRRSSVLDPLVETYRRCLNEASPNHAKISEDWREFTDQLNSRTTAFAIDTSPEAQGRQQYRNP